MSSARLVTWGTIPLATLAAGATLPAGGSTVTMFALGGTMVAIAAIATASPIVRNAPRIEDLHPTESASAH